MFGILLAACVLTQPVPDNSGLAAPRLSFSQEQAKDKPNVLFIVTDDMNDWVGCLRGRPDVKTPNIDRLASRGVLFARAYCSATVCNPSRTSVLTGVLSSTSGVYANPQPFRVALPDAVTIPQHFMGHGYHTVRGGKIFHASGDDASWREALNPRDYYKKRDPKIFRPIYTIRRPGSGLPGPFAGGPLGVSDEDMYDTQVANWVGDYLNRRHDKPFFLACGFSRPHLPWFVPKKYFDMYPPAEITLPAVKDTDLDDVPSWAKRRHEDLIAKSDEEWRTMVAAYLASISFVDANIGRLLDALNKSPYAGNTIVVFWSDHGFSLGEHYHWGKGSLWERDMHVPLIMAGPGIKAGGRCHRTVSLVDIYPTLADLCGLPPRKGLDGVSLLPLLKAPDTPWDRPALASSGRGRHGIRSERWHYTRTSDGNEQLYDHENDPHEWTNLADNREYDSVKEKLRSWLPKVDAEYPVAYGRNVQSATPKNWEGYFSVDLRGHCNRIFKDDVAGDRKGGWTDHGVADMRYLPVGEVVLGGSPFKIIDPYEETAPEPQKSCIVLRDGKDRTYFPKEARGIAVGEEARELMFLHCSVGRAGLKGSEDVGKYTVTYEDGSKVEVPLKYNDNIGDWRVGRHIPRAKAAWIARHPKAYWTAIGLFKFHWNNPHPDKRIRGQ